MKTTKRIITIAATLSFLVLGLGGAQEGKPAKTYKVQKDGLPLFNKPTPTLGIQKRLALGTELSVLRTKGAWKQVTGEGLGGWIQGRRKSVLGGKPVDGNYLKSKTTARIGAGLVTKGFSKSYASQNGVSETDSASTRKQLGSHHFKYEAFEKFLGQGNLRMGEALTELAASPGSDARGNAKPTKRPGPSGGTLGGLQRGISASKIRMEISRDPHYFAKNFSYEEEIEMGYAVAERLAAGKIHPSVPLNEYVNLIGAALVEHSERSDIPYVFTVLDSPQINAFAAPGGYIFITSGCLLACKNEAELAAVLGHEVAHVARRHGARQLDDHRAKIAKGMMGAQMDRTLEQFYGPMDPNKAALIKELQSMADLQYKSCTASWGQKFELEADEFGMRYAAAAGWDYSGLFEFLKVLRQGEKASVGAGWDSHPPANERLDNLHRIVHGENWKRSGNYQEARFKRALSHLQ